MSNQYTLPALDPTRQMLHDLGVPVHRIGYRTLREAIPLYAMDDLQSITKEVYPVLSKRFGFSGPEVVERQIRCAIVSAWKNGNRDIWNLYFPQCEKAPTNKQFISVLAEYLK